MRLTMNDGTVIEGGQAFLVGGMLRCFFVGYSMREAVDIFLDPLKTSRIIYSDGRNEEIFEGYTDCRSAEIDMEECLHVGMKKGEENNV